MVAKEHVERAIEALADRICESEDTREAAVAAEALAKLYGAISVDVESIFMLAKQLTEESCRNQTDTKNEAAHENICLGLIPM